MGDACETCGDPATQWDYDQLMHFCDRHVQQADFTVPLDDPKAAVSLVERYDGKLLAVWNRRYGGWSMPGGKVEPGETVEQAQARELREETGLETVAATLVYSAPTSLKDASLASDRGRIVHVFRVGASGVPRETEPGCAVRWMTRAEFLEQSPFRGFYREMFARLPDRM